MTIEPALENEIRDAYDALQRVVGRCTCREDWPPDRYCPVNRYRYQHRQGGYFVFRVKRTGKTIKVR
jgi:hypothetical protein